MNISQGELDIIEEFLKAVNDTRAFLDDWNFDKALDHARIARELLPTIVRHTVGPSLTTESMDNLITFIQEKKRMEARTSCAYLAAKVSSIIKDDN